MEPLEQDTQKRKKGQMQGTTEGIKLEGALPKTTNKGLPKKSSEQQPDTVFKILIFTNPL